MGGMIPTGAGGTVILPGITTDQEVDRIGMYLG